MNTNNNFDNINNIDNINESMGKLVVLSGPAGSGKGTVLKELFNLAEYKYSVSATTRTPRDGETEGVDYYFLQKEDFLRKVSSGDMLEYVEYSGNYYGTLRDPVERMLRKGYNVILEIEVIGALNIKEKFPGAVMIFLTPPNYSELSERLINRGTETDEIIARRLEIAKKEVVCVEKYDYLVINENNMQKRAAFNIHCIVETEKHKNIQPKSMSREIEIMSKTAEENKITLKSAEDFLNIYFS